MEAAGVSSTFQVHRARIFPPMERRFGLAPPWSRSLQSTLPPGKSRLASLFLGLLRCLEAFSIAPPKCSHSVAAKRLSASANQLGPFRFSRFGILVRTHGRILPAQRHNFFRTV